MNEMIERVARAIAERRFGSSGKYMWQDWTTEAEAAIEAMLEPTEEMVDAGREGGEVNIDFDFNAAACWQAMIDAALNPAEDAR
jgi:hypothetical protein